MGISKKIQTSMKQGSWTRRMFEEANALKEQLGAENVFDLSLGNPITEPPIQFFQELSLFIENPTPGMHRYMPNAGYPETRAAVAAQLGVETGLNFTANEILMTCGAGGALNVALKTLLDPGNEVIIFAPYFWEYLFYVDNHGGTCRIVPPSENFYPDLKAFEDSISADTKVVLVNSPNNPSGVVYSSELLASLGEVIRKKEREYGGEIFLISDEPYRKILFDDAEYPHIFPYHVRSIVVTSHSKDLALPGERIGYIAVNPRNEDAPELVDGLIFCNRTLGFVNAPALMQHIVKNLQSVTVDVTDYQDKRDYLYTELTNIGYSIIKPQGAFYMFPRCPIEDDVAFVGELQKHNVLVVPGRGFGMPGYFRISFCVTDRELRGAMPGFRAAMEAVK